MAEESILTQLLNSQDMRWGKDIRRVTSKSISVTRISKSDSGLACRWHRRCNKLTRPILASLGSEEEKFKLIGNLSVLKGQQDYAGISVTEDLTPEQRRSFKMHADEAKAHNNADGAEYILRVRGTSKNGFYLKKITLTQTQ